MCHLSYFYCVVTSYLRRGALIIRRLCVLLDAEKLYREFSTILELESNLDFASVMVQVVIFLSLKCTNEWPNEMMLRLGTFCS